MDNCNTVYKYTNKINGKVYIGRTKHSIEKRAGTNGINYKTCTTFWHAICKYGWENFSLEILAENLTYQQSIDVEKHYIEMFQSTDITHGYNIMKQEPWQGNTMPDSVREKLRQARLNMSEEKKQRIASAHFRGNTPWNKGIKTGPLTEKQKEKFSEARKGNKNSIHVSVRNVDTGEIFRSGAEAGRSIGCTSEAIFCAIKENRPCKGFRFERVCE